MEKTKKNANNLYTHWFVMLSQMRPLVVSQPVEYTKKLQLIPSVSSGSLMFLILIEELKNHI